ncbi:RNA polymerase sporulation sigma factor SigH [Acetivibrio ethanolgignens]|uniref:RNA polymerase sigma factor SigS n=1 Tax=Acetivibrio ethanolgignens TaxID=290052 RepID=A0A0V8QEV0_9FIRM|nr:RNA polymerase sporulation sigma factor SigH [Acetivibrio ethanolgignens]KSV59079.1 RNA polymerase subunit sigma-70 [Acetivibrio ethanolgignens]
MNAGFEKMKDEELIGKVRKGDKRAVDYLMDKYKNLVRQKARRLFLIGGDREDLIQEGMIGLYKAIRDYTPEREASFCSFANLCIERQIYSAIKASNRQKNLPLNTYISFSDVDFVENDAKESIFGNNQLNPEKLIIDKESISVLEYKLVRHLSPFEKKVFELFDEGKKYTEIAEELHKSPKSIDNALQRIKTKLNQTLLELE